jgi:CRP/FNR family transcriptional regulator
MKMSQIRQLVKMMLPEIEPRYLQVLQQSFLLQKANPKLALELLTQHQWQIAKFSKGQQVYGNAEWQGYLGFLLSGQATAYSSASDGAAILRSFAPGDLFGAASLFVAEAEPLSYIVADQATEVLFLARSGLEQHLAQNWPLAENYIRFLALRIAFLNRKIKALSAGSTTAKLAIHILEYSLPNAHGRPVFRGNISKLAQSLGISRASLYRSLDILVATGCLNHHGREIEVLDWHRLQEWAD